VTIDFIEINLLIANKIKKLEITIELSEKAMGINNKKPIKKRIE
jgi:hypothetical protein